MLDTLLVPGGRTGRVGFWTAVPALGILYLVCGLALAIVGDGVFAWKPIWLGAALVALTVAFLGCGTVVGIRRLHDRDESGWWILLALIPVVGQLWYLVWNGARPGSGVDRFDADTNAAIGAVFDDEAPVAPRRRRRPRASVAVAVVLWIGLFVMTLVTILLFQQPAP